MSLSDLEHNEQKCAELEAAIEVVEILTAIPSQIKSGDDLLKLLAEQGAYQDKIQYTKNTSLRQAELTERPSGKDLLSPLSDTFKQKLSGLKSSADARQFLTEQLASVNLSFEEIDFKPSVDAEKDHNTRHIIRMEFNGMVQEPDEDFLSDAYLRFKNNPSPTPTKPEDYFDSLEQNPYWETFKKFPNFVKKEDLFRRSLADAGFPKEDVKHLNTFDLEDLLYKYTKKQESEKIENRLKNTHNDRDKLKLEKNLTNTQEATSHKIFEGAREFAVKTFAHNHRKELEEQFIQLGALDGIAEQLKIQEDKRKQRFGDTSVTELTPEQLKEKSKARLSELLDRMEKEGATPLIPLAGGNSLIADVHHNLDIKDAMLLKENGAIKDITDVNNPNNFMIIYRRQGNEDAGTEHATRASFKTLDKAFKKNKIVIDDPELLSSLTSQDKNGNETVDISRLLSSKEDKKNFIKKFVNNKDRANALFKAFTAMGIPPETILSDKVMKPMLTEGTIPEINLPNNKRLTVSLKKTRKGLKFVFGSEAKSSQYADIHHSILHALSKRPISEEISNDANAKREIIADNSLENTTGERAFSVKSENPKKRVAYRVRENLNKLKNHIVFMIAGFGENNLIQLNDKDEKDIQNHQNQLAREGASANAVSLLNKARYQGKTE